MKKKTGLKGIISLILCLVMCLSVVPAEVKATEPLPAITGVSIDSAGVLTWDSFPGAVRYSLYNNGTNWLTSEFGYDTTNCPPEFKLKEALGNRNKPSGEYTFKLVALDSPLGATLNYISEEYTITYTYEQEATAVPDITVDSLPLAAKGVPYDETLTAESKTADGYKAYTTWTLKTGSSLPAGLTLKNLGILDGTPTEAGTFTFTVVATNSKGSSEKELTLTVKGEAEYKLTGFAVTATGIQTDVTDGGYKALIETSAVPSWETGSPTDYSIEKSRVSRYNDLSDGGFTTEIDGGDTVYIKYTLYTTDNGTFDFSQLQKDDCTITVEGFKDGVCYSVADAHGTAYGYNVDIYFQITRLFNYTVAYNTTDYVSGPGAAAPAVASARVQEGQTVTEPEAPLYDGYKFLGWYTAATCLDSEKFDFSTAITGDRTLYAKWDNHPTHTFDKEVAESAYLKSEADCEHSAVYYKSCVCGLSSKGTTGEVTFESGSPLGHSSTGTLFASTVKAADATCTKSALYYAYCDNMVNYESHINPDVTVDVGNPLGHSFGTTASSEKASDASCTTPAYYYVKCDRCGEVDRSKTVAVGAALGHSFGTTASSEKASDATCTAPAYYYVKCDRCGETDRAKVVAVGSTIAHSFTTKASSRMATSATEAVPATYYVQCNYCNEISTSITVAVGSPLPKSTYPEVTPVVPVPTKEVEPELPVIKPGTDTSEKDPETTPVVDKPEKDTETIPENLKKDYEFKKGYGYYKVLKDGVAEVVYEKPSKARKSVTIPDTITINNVEYKVVQVSAKAFYKDSKLQEIKLGKNIQKVGTKAFYGCEKLKSVTFPENVTAVGKYAFARCSSLEQVIFEGEKLTSLGTKSFYRCPKLESVSLPASLKKLGSAVFARCRSLKNIVLPGEQLKSVGAKAFRYIAKKPVFTISEQLFDTYSTMIKDSIVSGKAVFNTAGV